MGLLLSFYISFVVESSTLAENIHSLSWENISNANRNEIAMEEPNPAHAPDGRSSSSLQLLGGLFPRTADNSCTQVIAEKGCRKWRQGSAQPKTPPLDLIYPHHLKGETHIPRFRDWKSILLLPRTTQIIL